MPKISELDSRILKILLKNGRAGYDSIARDCGETENKIWKRCKSMERKGIIKGATVQMNFGYFGYAALATMLISAEAQQMDQVMEVTKKITEVCAYRQYNSVYNVRAVATLLDLKELDHVKHLIKRNLPTLGIKTYIWAGVKNIPENIKLTNETKNSQEVLEKTTQTTSKISNLVKIDDIDRQIVQKLTLNGRVSFSTIAKEIGLSTDTVVKRYNKLRDYGAIKVSTQINPNIIGYSSILDFNIAFAASCVTGSVVDLLAKIPDVVILTKTSGDFDLHVAAMVRDMAHSFDMQDQIAKVCGMTKIEVSARKIPDSWPTPLQHISTF